MAHRLPSLAQAADHPNAHRAGQHTLNRSKTVAQTEEQARRQRHRHIGRLWVAVVRDGNGSSSGRVGTPLRQRQRHGDGETEGRPTTVAKTFLTDDIIDDVDGVVVKVAAGDGRPPPPASPHPARQRLTRWSPSHEVREGGLQERGCVVREWFGGGGGRGRGALEGLSWWRPAQEGTAGLQGMPTFGRWASSQARNCRWSVSRACENGLGALSGTQALRSCQLLRRLSWLHRCHY